MSLNKKSITGIALQRLVSGNILGNTNIFGESEEFPELQDFDEDNSEVDLHSNPYILIFSRREIKAQYIDEWTRRRKNKKKNKQ